MLGGDLAAEDQRRVVAAMVCQWSAMGRPGGLAYAAIAVVSLSPVAGLDAAGPGTG